VHCPVCHYTEQRSCYKQYVIVELNVLEMQMHMGVELRLQTMLLMLGQRWPAERVLL